ncbi:MAG TPA: thermonuclease family protein [Actinomycetota bacterium]|nr:thermonuclease family protein [Actinomycetota bacterium]
MTASVRRVRSIPLVLLTSALSATTACSELGHTPPGDAGVGRTSVQVVQVVDGDTIRVDLGGRETPVRLIGIDTPERDGPFTDEECFGGRASRFTADTLGGLRVDLEFDVERTDRFDRTLAYVWVEGSLFNERILREGYAVLATFPPNVRYVQRLRAAQRRARDAGAGLWGVCPAG